MEDIRIPITCTCRECDGTGIIYNTDYNEFSKFLDGRLIAHPEYKTAPTLRNRKKQKTIGGLIEGTQVEFQTGLQKNGNVIIAVEPDEKKPRFP